MDEKPEVDAGRRVAVLLVEDSPVIRESLVDLVEEDDRCKVAAFAETERDACELLQRGHFDVAIVDLQLRQGTGQGVLRALAGHAGPGLVIVLTNFARPEVRAQCLALGAHHFFDKSREFEQVSEAIDRYLSAQGSGAAH